jgi:hypothetical protein
MIVARPDFEVSQGLKRRLSALRSYTRHVRAQPMSNFFICGGICVVASRKVTVASCIAKPNEINVLTFGAEYLFWRSGNVWLLNSWQVLW